MIILWLQVLFVRRCFLIWSLFFTDNKLLLSLRQDPKLATFWQLSRTHCEHNTWGLVPKAAWIIGALWTFQMYADKKIFQYAVSIKYVNLNFNGLLTADATAVSMWWSPAKLDTTLYTPSLCLSAFVRIITTGAFRMGTGDLQKLFRGLWRFPSKMKDH